MCQARAARPIGHAQRPTRFLRDIAGTELETTLVQWVIGTARA